MIEPKPRRASGLWHASTQEQELLDLDLAIARTLDDMMPQHPMVLKLGGPTISMLQGTLMWYGQLPECEAKTGILSAIRKYLEHTKRNVDAIASGKPKPFGE